MEGNITGATTVLEQMKEEVCHFIVREEEYIGLFITLKVNCDNVFLFANLTISVTFIKF